MYASTTAFIANYYSYNYVTYSNDSNNNTQIFNIHRMTNSALICCFPMSVYACVYVCTYVYAYIIRLHKSKNQ